MSSQSWWWCSYSDILYFACSTKDLSSHLQSADDYKQVAGANMMFCIAAPRWDLSWKDVFLYKHLTLSFYSSSFGVVTWSHVSLSSSLRKRYVCNLCYADSCVPERWHKQLNVTPWLHGCSETTGSHHLEVFEEQQTSNSAQRRWLLSRSCQL